MIAGSLYQEEYKIEAENKALYFTLQLADEQREAFFERLKKVCSDKSSTYKLLHDKFDALKNDSSPVTRQHKHFLVSAIIPFIEKKYAFDMFLLEAKDTIHNLKKACARNTSSYEKDVVDKYYAYYKKLLDLQPSELKWFLAEDYTKEEAREIVQAAVYTHIEELKIYANDFIKDVNIIYTDGSSLINKITYEEKLLGLSVKMKNKEVRLFNIENVFIEQFYTKYEEFIHEYINHEIEELEHQERQNYAQDAVLRHDLRTTITHIKNNVSIFKKVDFSLELNGMAGLIKVGNEIEHEEEDDVADKTNIPQIIAYVIAIPFALLLGLPMLFLAMVLLYMGGYFSLIAGTVAGGWLLFREKSYKKKPLNYRKNELNSNLRRYVNEYSENLQKIKKIRRPIYNKFDNILERMWERTLTKVRNKFHDMQDPVKTLILYKRLMKKISSFYPNDMEEVFDNGSELPPHVFLSAMRFMLLYRIRCSYLQFVKVMSTLIDYRLDGKVYLFDIMTDVTLYEVKKRQRIYQNKVFYIGSFNEYIAAKPDAETFENEEFRNWYIEKLAYYDAFESDNSYEFFRQQAFATWEDKKGRRFAKSPVYYDNEMIVVFGF